MVENKSIGSCIRMFFTYAIIIFLGLLCFLPLWNVVCMSFSSATAIRLNKVSFLPVDFNIMAYEKIMNDGQFWRSFAISVIRVFLAVIINLVLMVLMAYPLTKTKEEFHARDICMRILIFAMMFSGGMIPTYMLVKNLHLLNTIWALVLPGAVPIFNMIMVMNFFLGVPKSLEEAAIIDGASPLQVLLRVLIPCSKPVLATVALFSIVGNWNDYFSGIIYITRMKNHPLMTYIQSFNVDIKSMVERSASAEELADAVKVSAQNLNSAKIVIATVPLLMIYPFLQKYLITGIVLGSVKE